MERSSVSKLSVRWIQQDAGQEGSYEQPASQSSKQLVKDGVIDDITRKSSVCTPPTIQSMVVTYHSIESKADDDVTKMRYKEGKEGRQARTSK